MNTIPITPDDIRRTLENMTLRDIVTSCALAHVLIRERGCDLSATAGPRRFTVYRGSQERLGYLDVLANYSTAWYPMPTKPVQFTLDLQDTPDKDLDP